MQFLSVSELDDTDDGSVVNVEAVLLDDVGVPWFESGMNLKKLIRNRIPWVFFQSH